MYIYKALLVLESTSKTFIGFGLDFVLNTKTLVDLSPSPVKRSRDL